MEEHYLQQSASTATVGDVPESPNLLPAYFAEDDHPQMEKYVVKPIFSREGANVSIIENGKPLQQRKVRMAKKG